jgi:hypothetical protein
MDRSLWFGAAIAICRAEPKRLNSKLGGKKIMANSKPVKKSSKLVAKKLEKKTTLKHYVPLNKF